MAETAVIIVIDKLVSLLTEEGNLLRGIHDEVTSIKDLLESMTSFLKDADEKAQRANNSSGVKTWVKQTREMASHIEDVIDEYMHHVARNRDKQGLSGFLHKTTHIVGGLFTRHEISLKIQLIKKRIREILKTSVAYGFNSTQEIPFSSSRRDNMSFDQQMTSLYTEEAELVGIQTLRDKLIGWSIGGEVASRRSVSSVVGMGGLGKTTLAKKVFDNSRFTEWFDWRAWITVSQSYKNEDILRNMIIEFHRTRNESVLEGIETMDLRLLIHTLRGYLKEKRYAVVFDDVWSTNLWGCVKLALPDNNNGSRIIITTRKGEVAASCREAFSDQVYDLEPLSPDKAWELFCKKTFRDSSGYCPPELKKFATTIVSRCGGLPLAIVAISGLLSTRGGDVPQWRKLHDSLGSELESNPHLTNVTKILSFSYHDLPHRLKPCFLYFGTYPENCPVRCSTLIRQWIAEGFIQEQRGKTLEEVAEEYLAELIQRSLVQVSYVDERGVRRECQVHDVMREAVILLKTRDMSFSQFLEEDSRFNENSRHLSVDSNAYNSFGSIGSSRAHSLCFFNGIGGPQNPLTSCRNLYKRFKLLRVLDFEDSLLDHLPEEVGYMYHLKYLSLRNTRVKILPKSIGKLANLETLDLKQSLVHEIPYSINKLPKLRNLLAYNLHNNKQLGRTTKRAVMIHEGIEHWRNLQKLYTVEATDSLVKEIGNLKQLRRLGIQKLARKQGKDLCASIGKMSHLQSLEVVAINGDEIINLQSISPPPQRLQTLILIGRLKKLPDWIAGSSFLTRLDLSWSRLAGDPNTLKVLQGLPNLVQLLIYDAFSCEELHFEEGFPKLKELSLIKLNSLKFMRIHNGALPLLESLIIGPSPQLQQVPSGIRNLKNLKYLDFLDMPSHFIDGIQVQETEHRVGPRVIVVKTEGERVMTTKTSLARTFSAPTTPSSPSIFRFRRHGIFRTKRDYHCEVAKGARAESSAATVTYEELMDMLTLDEKKAWVESSPTKVFDFDPKIEKVVVVDPEAYTYDDQVIKKAEATGKPGLVDIIAKEDSFIFTVESTGAVKASQLLLNAIEVLNQKLGAVRLSEDTVEADDQFGELGAHMRGG
ncbi:PREDICTED: disease resistance protein RPM1-like [Prunus mume]|uniref:Disease resistance protein RPM1-like n=1 Tax=Prunus mume TaxID=102107 RepID=A0ABM1LSS1_PRUMU|nr:PREDICTED: disease resistance protein RPM1-like [Prunus mume]